MTNDNILQNNSKDSPLGGMGGSGSIIITGASGSVGEAATLAMAQKGWHVIMACRNIEKGTATMNRIIEQCPSARLELQELEMSSPASIRDFAQRLEGRTINALFNNAGIMTRHFSRATEWTFHPLPTGRAGEGLVGLDFAVNYLGTALLTQLIIPLMPAGSNIVNMVSLTARFGKLTLDWPDWDEHHFGQLSTYAASKKAVLLHTIALARRHPELHINVADPGIVNSNMISMDRWYDPLADIFFRPFIKTPEQGAQSALNALQSKDSLLYYVGNKSKPIANKFLNSTLVEQLWQQLPF